MSPPKPRPRNVEELQGGEILRDYEAEKVEHLRKIASELDTIGLFLILCILLFCYVLRDVKSELQKIAQGPAHVVIVSSEKEAERK